LIYHLPDPMRALKIVHSLCRRELYLETHIIDNGCLLPDGKLTPLRSIAPVLEQIPIMQFYPGSVLNDDPTNFWGPNMKCIEEMLTKSNFVVLHRHLHGGRGIFTCRVGQDSAVETLTNIAYGEEYPT